VAGVVLISSCHFVGNPISICVAARRTRSSSRQR